MKKHLRVLITFMAQSLKVKYLLPIYLGIVLLPFNIPTLARMLQSLFSASGRFMKKMVGRKCH
jgi:hypothetical protein